MQKRKSIILEEFLFFSHYSFHKQKLVFHRASMKNYEYVLQKSGGEVTYIDAGEKEADIRLLPEKLKKDGVKELHFVDPVDDWLLRRLVSACKKAGLSYKKYATPMFLNTPDEIDVYFKKKKRLFQNDFYVDQRKQRGILLDGRHKPLGGKWNFDAENRKKYPKKKTPPTVSFPDKDDFYQEAVDYVEKSYKKNPGHVSPDPIYAHTHESAQDWMTQFLETRFDEFGTYEDAIVARENILHHSLLSPAMNAGLLTPERVLEDTLAYARENDNPLNSLEGFIRQILGWREFIRAVYQLKGSEERTRNFWGFTRKIPDSFYTGDTGIVPLDITIKKVLKSAYCHHIERLMVLGNFMLLCEFDPDEVYQWFMELFIDAYDWVMVPNVYGMSQFADGGLMATKPYISGSNYLMKMSDYPKGEWQKIWDGLFWRFMDKHRGFFTGNPRLGMLVRSFDKMGDEKKESHLATAQKYLDGLV